MFPYCCLLIICIMLFPCSVFKVHLSLFAQRRPRFLPRTSFNEYISKKRFLIVREADTSIFHFSFFTFHFSFRKVVGQSGLEPPTSRLSVVCSSQLSYWPASFLCHCEPVRTLARQSVPLAGTAPEFRSVSDGLPRRFAPRNDTVFRLLRLKSGGD